MGSPKPLLPVDGGTFIGHIIKTFRAAGADPIVVVTGHEAARLEEALQGTGAILLPNARYAETEMFASVRIGLSYLSGRCDRVLLTPVDVPLFSLDTVLRLLESGASLACPAHNGETGHPLLIGETLFHDLLAFDEQGGLRAALASLKTPLVPIETEDEAVLLEADTPAEYERLLGWSRQHSLPDREACLALLRARNLPEHIIRHSVAVADRALVLGKLLNAAGVSMDLRLVEAGALLHDIARLEKHHDEVGARLVTQLGYPALAPIIAAHMDLNVAGRSRITEALVVFLADKQVEEDYPVTVEERYDSRLPKITDPRMRELVLIRRAEALEAQELVQKALRENAGS
jgi:CTP:molybdopterin cytidylyltransferase MocA